MESRTTMATMVRMMAASLTPVLELSLLSDMVAYSTASVWYVFRKSLLGKLLR